ncbi:MAG: ribonuclease H, partial [Muribaculaceae bacterium]|nr:ribonuclease H [Muribaculaceae bacterium]
TAIYSDSRTAQIWVRKRKCGTKLVRTPKNTRLLDIVARAEQWLQNHSFQNPIYKWQTDKWGEIPADFGRK